MFLGLLVLFTALSISAVAIYYSVAGLVAIFAAASVPIMIMGGALEIGKLVTAVWLHRYWHKASWWLKTYLSIAVVVLMFITSMGIFGFLSKAHIEQTAGAQEGVAQIARIEAEIDRQKSTIEIANSRIIEAQTSVERNNNAIQEKIDIEQSRIDTAYERIQPAIDEQNSIIESTRAADAKRTEPYEQQLSALDEELRQISIQAEQYEQRVSDLKIDNTAIQPIINQIETIEESISLVQGQLAGGESSAIQSAQRTIGVEPDGRAGPATRRAADAWISQQQTRINELQTQIAQGRQQAQVILDNERTRLTTLIAELRGPQTESVKARQIQILDTIDQVRSTESPLITAAREEIQRIRAGAEAQISQSNTLIQNLRESLTIGKDNIVESVIAEQNQKIIDANNTIDTLTQQKYQLQADYRKLEAEVGPIKYLAEFIYGETADEVLLEEAVKWVIIIIIFVFDPLAVLLLIASQSTFEMRRQEDVDRPKKEVKDVNIIRSNNDRGIVDPALRTQPDTDQYKQDNSYNDPRLDNRKNEVSIELLGTGHEGRGLEQPEIFITQENENDRGIQEDNVVTNANVGDHSSENNIADSIADVHRMEQVEIQIDEDRGLETKKKDIEFSEDLRAKLQDRENEYNKKINDATQKEQRQAWKKDNPNSTMKHYKTLYIHGMIDKLPWEDYVAKDVSYKQNEEQNSNTLFQKLKSMKSE